jgi:hypothetical protein
MRTSIESAGTSSCIGISTVVAAVVWRRNRASAEPAFTRMSRPTLPGIALATSILSTNFFGSGSANTTRANRPFGPASPILAHGKAADAADRLRQRRLVELGRRGDRYERLDRRRLVRRSS